MIFLILILAFILRLINVNQSFWLDESTQLILSSKSLQQIIFERSADFHPPLSYLLTHYWLLISQNEIWLRLLPILFGIGTIFVVYKLSLDLFNKKIALLASFLLGISPYFVYYSQEMRMYSMLSFFATLSIYFFSNLKNEGKNYQKSFGYVLSTTCLIYTHYFGFFLIIAQFLFVGFYNRKLFKSFLIKLLIIALLWMPWLPLFLSQLQNGQNADVYLPGWSSVLSLPIYKSIPLTFLQFTIGRIEFENPILYPLIALFVLSIVAYFLITAVVKNKQINEKLILIWLVIPILLAFIISFKLPVYQPFRLLLVLPAFYILLAIGILKSAYPKISLFLLITISLLGLFLYNIEAKFQREDWRGAVNFVLNKTNNTNAIVFAWPEPFDPFKWYTNNRKLLGQEKNIHIYSVVQHFPGNKEEIYNNLNLTNQKEYFVFAYLQDLSDPNHFIQQWLTDNDFLLRDTYNFNGVGFIYDYVKK